MKYVRSSMGSLALFLVISLGMGPTSKSNAAAQLAEVVIGDVVGNVSYSTDGTWRPLKKDMKLSHGAIIKTGANSTVDLLLHSSFSALRLTPNSSLRLDKLHREAGYDKELTETTLTLLAGSVAGTQRKLAAPSRFQINVAGEVVTIVGTEYYVRSDGAVTVISGMVSINYNLPNGSGSVKVTVSAGFTFDPTTGQVVPTTPEYLQNIIAHITTTKQNAETFKAGGATLVVKPERYISPH